MILQFVIIPLSVDKDNAKYSGAADEKSNRSKDDSEDNQDQREEEGDDTRYVQGAYGD